MHTQADGSNIGGTPPDTYGFIQSPPNSPNGILMHTQSAAKAQSADWEIYIQRPLLPNTGNLQWDFDLTTDGNAPSVAQAIETDIIVTDANGYNYNMSLQCNYAEGGHTQIANQTGGWIDTGFNPGKYAPHTTTHYSVIYWFNFVSRTFGITNINIGGQDFPVVLQKLNAVHSGWSEGAMLQLQQDLVVGGGSYSLLFENITLSWW